MRDEQLEIEPAPATGESGQFVVEMSCCEGRYSLNLSGELDAACSARLEAAVQEVCDRCPVTLALDLRELVFMDSSGLRVVLLAHTLCRERGIELSILPGAPQVQRVFEVVGVLDILPFHTGPPTGDSEGSP